MKYTCPTCNHDAIHHFALGTKCSVEGCDCMRSQNEVVNGAIAARIATLEAERDELIAALEKAIHEIKMVHWGKFSDATWQEVNEKNPVIIEARAVLAKVQRD